MKTISIFTICVFFLFGCAVTNTHSTNDFKKWDKNDPLKWKDFKAMPPYSELPAVTQWGLFFKMSDTARDVHAYFYKPKSWCRAGDKRILEHEQYHFNIAEIYARQVRKEITSQNYRDTSAVLFTFIQKKMEECKQMQTEYEKATEYSKNKVQQIKWKALIDKQLLELDAYSDPIF